MLRDSAVSLIAARCGNRTDLDVRIVAELQYAQEVLEQREFLPWFLLTESSSPAFTVEVPSTALTGYTGFIREAENDEMGEAFVIDPDTAVWTKLKKAPLSELLYANNSVDAETGLPTRYALTKTDLYISPKPDKAYTVRFRYYATDTVLSSNIENQWLKYAPDLLIGMAGAAVALYTGNVDAAGYFQAQEAKAFDRMVKQTTARREAGLTHNMGED